MCSISLPIPRKNFLPPLFSKAETPEYFVDYIVPCFFADDQTQGLIGLIHVYFYEFQRLSGFPFSSRKAIRAIPATDRTMNTQRWELRIPKAAPGFSL